MQETEIDHSNTAYLPYVSTLAYILLAGNLIGFVGTEDFKQKLKKLDLKKKPDFRLMEYYETLTPPILFYIYQLPVCLSLLAFANGTGYMERYGSIIVLMILPQLVLGDMKQKEGLWTCPKSFGIRGMMVGVTSALALVEMLNSKEAGIEREFEVLSLVSFANAAWHACGVGSVAGWTAHPELGDFGAEKRLELAHMQVYFFLGFVFRYLAIKQFGYLNFSLNMMHIPL